VDDGSALSSATLLIKSIAALVSPGCGGSDARGSIDKEMDSSLLEDRTSSFLFLF